MVCSFSRPMNHWIAGGGPRNPRTQPLVLIVEDDRDTREMYAQFLAVYGYWTAEAQDGLEAVRLATLLKPDVITIDISLAGAIDGCHLTETLRSDARTSRIPVIVVTGWAIGGQIERAQQAGCDAVLVKPCLPQDLLAEIQRLLQRIPEQPQVTPRTSVDLVSPRDRTD
jgi:two-component system, cell cycle response regulator DivK